MARPQSPDRSASFFLLTQVSGQPRVPMRSAFGLTRFANYLFHLKDPDVNGNYGRACVGGFARHSRALQPCPLSWWRAEDKRYCYRIAVPVRRQFDDKNGMTPSSLESFQTVPTSR